MDSQDDIPTDRLPLFPFTRTDPFHPPAEYARARRECPVSPVRLWNRQRAWLLTRLEQVRSVLQDRRFSGEFARPDFPAVTEARVAIDKAERAFVGMDNPRHQHFRRMFTREFSHKRMMALRPRIEAITAGLLDRMAAKGPPADLVEDLAVQLPALVMCELFGSPYEDRTYIMKCAAGRHGMRQSPAEAAQTARDLVDYCRTLIDAKERVPADDMLSRVIAEYVVPGTLSRDELADICAMILRAGHDTTTNMIGAGTLVLFQHPEQLAKLKADPSLVERAVEELLRYVTPVQFAPRRVALEDVELCGQRIRRGDGIFAVGPSANRDADAFPDPDRLDIERDASQHVSFGYGIHQCLGQGLARIELHVAFNALFARFPGLRLAVPLAEVPFKFDSQIFGVYRLPVAW
ncbi:MAG: cytochrome P450 [Alphaproteobacteria bacterium]|nr:cytochrome P450 [Alphaproteobacteria bacterium]